MRKRGFSLLEVVLVLVLFSVLAALGFQVFTAARMRIDAASARHSVRGVVSAERRLWVRESRFSSDTGELTNLEGAYTYVGGSTPSTDKSVISVAAGTSDGLEAVGIAVRERGVCEIAVVVGPGTPEPQTGSWLLGDGEAVCNGLQAFSNYGPGSGEWRL